MGLGLLVLAIDIVTFLALWSQGNDLATSHILSFTLASLIYIGLAHYRTRDAGTRHRPWWAEYGEAFTLFALVLILRGGVLAMLTEQAGLPAGWAIIVLAALSLGMHLLGRTLMARTRRHHDGNPGWNWDLTAAGLVGYAVLLRLVYLGLPDLLPEEAYYWNYAQHLDLSYLDHPPMVAWLIWAGTAVFGDTEAGVRIGSLLCWLMTAGFCYGLAYHTAGRSIAIRAVLLVAALPYFMIFGLFITPDAPLTAFWAGTLFFLHRALIGDKRVCWWCAGVCLGLGMLSKYTIALLCPAALVFLILDRRSRRWLLRPEPYAASMLATLLFMPVIIWNAKHNWVSFFFQGTRRVQGDYTFSLHLLVLYICLLITPLGIIGVCKAFWDKEPLDTADGPEQERARRGRLFTAVFTLIPLSVFVVFSVLHQPKPSWTGPIWLAILPALAIQMAPRPGVQMNRVAAFGQRLWPPTLAIVLLMMGGTFHYMVLGLPGMTYPEKMRLPVAWEEMALQVEMIEREVRRDGHEAPLVVGMDKYFVASEMAFYRRGGGEEAAPSTSRHLFNLDGLMYAYWNPPNHQVGRSLVLVGLTRAKMADRMFKDHVLNLGPIEERVVTKNGRTAARFYYRVAHGYHTNNLTESRYEYQPLVAGFAEFSGVPK